jgi:hypothetical protein
MNDVSITKNLIDYCVNPTDLNKLNELSSNQILEILPFLTRLWIRNNILSEENEFDNPYLDYKLAIYDKLRDFDETNRICSYLNADFSQIYEDVIRHLSTRYLSFAFYSYKKKTRL